MPTSTPSPLDLRGLDPPEPLLRILETLGEEPGRTHVFLLPFEPRPLYPLLSANGWCHRLQRGPDGCELTVFRRIGKP